MKYWFLEGCSDITKIDDDIYECGEGGGNLMFENGEIWEDTGNGSMTQVGIASQKSIDEFTGIPDGSGKMIWNGNNWILESI